MTLVSKRRGLESSKARGYYSLYYLSLIIYKSQKRKKSYVQDLRTLQLHAGLSVSFRNG